MEHVLLNVCILIMNFHCIKLLYGVYSYKLSKDIFSSITISDQTEAIEY